MRTIEIGDDLRPKVEGPDRMTANPAGYGFVVTDDSGEWALVVQFTSRQDGKTAYGMLLTQVDDSVKFRSGQCKTEHLGNVIHRLLYHITSHWLDPINAGVSRG